MQYYYWTGRRDTDQGQAQARVGIVRPGPRSGSGGGSAGGMLPGPVAGVTKFFGAGGQNFFLNSVKTRKIKKKIDDVPDFPKFLFTTVG